MVRFPEERSCLVKRQFSRYADAERALDRLQRAQPEDKQLHIYSCKYCKQFHIGHKVKGVKV